MSRLIVVSNRLPLTLRREAGTWTGIRSAGGLVTALSPLLESTRGLWIGWPGEAPEAPDDARREVLQRWATEHRLAAVELPRGISQKFYLGYANRTLWPLFHSFPSRFDFEPEGWDAYAEANRRFRDAVLRHHQPGDLVWVHDYHLMLLPQLLREAVPDIRVGFFLHTPFPASDLFRVLPRREDLLRGLLGADLIGFHTHGYLRHFRTAVLRVLGLQSSSNRMEARGRTVHLGAFPIGIVTEEFLKPLESDPDVATARAELARRFTGQRIVLAVDRLDYTKGIPERLRAFRRLLERSPHLRGTVTLVQIAVPSRGDIPRYRDLSDEVSRLVGEVNGTFGTASWTPVVFIRRGVSRADLVALYAAAEVAWVTPLRDGMNLVAKEYVACQPEHRGVLVLSELAGAAAEMGDTLLVNPYDEEGTGQAIERALAMPREERARRMEGLRRRVLTQDAAAWSGNFLDALRSAERPSRASVAVEPADVIRAFGLASRRLVVLDYDGTLVSLSTDAARCAPSPKIRALLGRLAALPRTRTAVVSGRSRADLNTWIGDIPSLWLAAEHGGFLRRDGEEWQPARPEARLEWKTQVHPLLEDFVDLAPGSFVEEKECSLVWHFRQVEHDKGERLARELLVTLDGLLGDEEARATLGHKVVDVRPMWANKGSVVGWLDAGDEPFDFRLAAGDDTTDEELFAQLPADAWTVRVGSGITRARLRVSAPGDVERLLEALA